MDIDLYSGRGAGEALSVWTSAQVKSILVAFSCWAAHRLTEGVPLGTVSIL